MAVYHIEDHKPHITIQGFKSVHVVPVSLIEDIASGKIKISDVEQFDDFIPTLIQEWIVSMLPVKYRRGNIIILDN